MCRFVYVCVCVSAIFYISRRKTHYDSVSLSFSISEKSLVWLISFTFKRTGLLGCLLGTLIRQRRSPESYKCIFLSPFFFTPFLWYLLKPSILYRVFKTRLKMFIIALQEKREIEKRRERDPVPEEYYYIILKSRNDKMCKASYQKLFR